MIILHISEKFSLSLQIQNLIISIMTVISSKEFATNQDKYFNLALDEKVFIKKGGNMFIVYNTNNHLQEDMIYKPDEDFYRSITMEEVQNRLHKVLDKLYAEK